MQRRKVFENTKVNLNHSILIKNGTYKEKMED